MRTVSLRVTDLIKSVLPIGFVGENLHTKVIIDSKTVFDEYPDAVVSMTVKPPKGDAYPAIVTRDGDIVTWDVSDSDLLYEGSGEIQLAFVVDEVIAKSYIGHTRIQRSIIPTGEIPEPIDDWITQANEILESIPGQIDSALEEAKESGEFDGDDGFSPEVSVEEIAGGHQITITDAEGVNTFNVMDGEKGDPGDPGSPGQDGFSPSASVSKSGNKSTITITDKTGTTTAEVLDGSTGPAGPGIASGGATGQVLKKKSNTDYDTEWGDDAGGVQIDDAAGIGDTGVTWSANKSATELSKKYVKPSGGIPASDIANGVVPDISGKADKVSNATSGDFAGLDSNGNLTDSGSKASDFISASLKGSNNGVAELDASGRVPSSQLPSYVDDVEEYSSLSAFPATGESGKIYIALDTNRTYRWSGSSYVAISSDLSLGETSSTAYRGDRGAEAYAAAVTNVESSPSSGSSNLITSGAVYTGLESVDNQVIISDTQPTATSNKLWIDSDDTGTEVQVPTYAEYTTALAGKVSDVQVNGTSVVSSGVANIPSAGSTTLGVINLASDSEIKSGSNSFKAVTPYRSGTYTFYGLAKAAGADMASISETTVGTYPDAQKIAIQKMLGVYQAPWELIIDSTVTNSTEADITIQVDSNGNPLQLTDLVLLFETPQQETEAKKGDYGTIYFYYKNTNDYVSVAAGTWTQAANASANGTSVEIENKDDLIFVIPQVSSQTGTANYLRRGYKTGFTGAVQGIQIIQGFYVHKIKISAVTGTGHFKLFGKRKWT